MNTDEKGNELPTITHYHKWERPLVYSREARYPYEKRPVQAWCRIELRGNVFHVHETFDEDWENHDLSWCFTEESTGAHVFQEKNVYPGVCMEHGWQFVLDHWSEYVAAKDKILIKIKGVVDTPSLLLCL